MSDRDQQAAHMAELSEARLSESTTLLDRANSRFVQAEATFAAAEARDYLASAKLDVAERYLEESRTNLELAVRCLTLAKRRMVWTWVLIGVTVGLIILKVIEFGWT